MPPSTTELPRRYAVVGLIAAGVSALASCTSRKTPDAQQPTGAAPTGTGSSAGESSSPSPSGPPPPDPTAIAAALAREASLIAAYDAAVRDVPAAAALLADFRGHHEAHIARLQELPGAPTPDPTPTESASELATEMPTAGASPSAPSSAAAKAAAAKARAAFEKVAKLERESSAGGAAACAAAGPTEFAVLLAEIAGSEAQHGALLPTFPAPVAS